MRIFTDGYTISDVVMYWRDEPVVGVEVRLESGENQNQTFLVLGS